MPSIENLINKTENDLPEVADRQENEQENKFFNVDLTFLKAETGEGEITDYKTHPLNFTSTDSLSRIIRGLTGLFGSLNYAVVDIILGVLEYAKEKKNNYAEKQIN
jgi:hypothetical protein